MDETGLYPTGTIQPPSGRCGTEMPIATQVQFPADDQVQSDESLKAWWCAKLLPEQLDAFGQVIRPEGIEVTVVVEDDVAGLTDSGPARRYDDDSVEIFIDGNNSKGNNYDGQDDYQFIFLADGDNTNPRVKGPAMPPSLTSNVVPANFGYVLDVFIPCEEVGIENGQPFGINVEVNDDDDGDGRDAKFSWVAKEGVDQSWVLPRKFGTSQIP